MTLEEKAQRFDEAINKAKSKIKNDKDHVLYEDDVLEIFPELKEKVQEDEELHELFQKTIDYIILNGLKSEINRCLLMKLKPIFIRLHLGKFYKENVYKVSDLEDLEPVCDVELKSAWNDKDEEILVLKDKIESLHAAIKALKETHKIEIEKHDEQKPNYCHHEVDLSECSEEYRKAYYDGWNNCNMQHSQCKSELDDVVKCLINGMKFYYEDNKEATWGTDKWSMPVKHIIEVLEKQGEQKPTMIQWNGDNLKEVIDFTGFYKEGFEKWFHNSWEEYEKYVHEHGNIFKIFNEDGSHIEVPVGAWIVKTPDGYNTASRYRFIQKPAWSEEDEGMVNYTIQFIETGWTDNGKSHLITWLKSLKNRVQPKQEWNEEDRKIIIELIGIFESAVDGGYADIPYRLLKDYIRVLKSCLPQNTWKPSDEQIKVLNEVLYFAANHESPHWNDYIFGTLNNHIRQLKKLREE